METDFMFSCSGGFRTDRGANENSVFPIQSFVNQRYTSRAATSKQNCIYWYSFGAFPQRVNDWALTGGCAKSIKSKQLNLHPDNFTCVRETYLEFGWAAGFPELLVQLASPNQLVISTPVTSFSKPSQKTPPSLVLKSEDKTKHDEQCNAKH